MPTNENPFVNGVCPYGEDQGKGAGCIKPTGHTGAHCVVPGEPDEDDLCISEFPGDDLHMGQLCTLPVGHQGSHRCTTDYPGTRYTRNLDWS